MYSINPRILHTPISEGKILLLEPKQGLYFELNEVSSLIFEGIQNNQNESEILDMIIQSFDVCKDEATSDMKSLIDEFRSNNIITKK